MIGAAVGQGQGGDGGEQPAEWGQQGGNWTLKALFMLGLFQLTLKTHVRTLRVSQSHCFSSIFENH